MIQAFINWFQTHLTEISFVFLLVGIPFCIYLEIKEYKKRNEFLEKMKNKATNIKETVKMKYFDGELVSGLDESDESDKVPEYTYCIAYRAPNHSIQTYIISGPNMKDVLDRFWRSKQGDKIYAITKLDDSITYLDLLKETCR